MFYNYRAFKSNVEKSCQTLISLLGGSMITMSSPTVTQDVRGILARHARLAVDAASLGGDSNLYQAGLTSLTTVNLMLALEDHFNIEFPDSMLGRNTFGSIEAIAEAVEGLVEG